MPLVLPSTGHNPATNSIIPASWGDDVNAAIVWMASAAPSCKAIRTTNQNINDATNTLITLPAEAWDIGGMHSTVTNTSRITIPSGEDAIYEVDGFCRYDVNATGRRELQLLVNGSAVSPATRSISSSASGSVPTPLQFTDKLDLAAGDYVEMQTIQSSTGTLAIVDAFLIVTWIRT